MAQKWYSKASVQTAIISGLFFLIGIAIPYLLKIPKLETEINQLQKENTDKTSEIQRLETMLTPFRTIALERYTGSEQETLRELAEELKTLQNKTQQLEDKPDFHQNIWEMLTGIPAAIFKDYHLAIDFYDQKDYQSCANTIQLAIDAYESKGKFDLKNYNEKQHKEKLSEIYSLAAKANNRIKKHDLSYQYAQKALKENPTHFTYYLTALTAYNLKKYQESMDNIDKAIKAKPTNTEPPISVYEQLKEGALRHLKKK